MTISSTTNRVSYAGDGGTTAFSFPHRFLAREDLTVILVVDATGVETTQTLTTDYTVTGTGDANGGTVNMVTAPATGEMLVIINDPDLTQDTDLADGSALPAESVESVFDRLTILVQRTRSLVTRSFRLPDGDTSGASLELPPPTALNMIRWDAAGTALENFEDVKTSGVTLSDNEIAAKVGAAVADGLPVPQNSVVGRGASGALKAMTAAEVRTLLGYTGTVAEWNKLDGFTGTTADLNSLLNNYDEQEVTLDGDFTGGRKVSCVRIGNVVTITANSVLQHSDLSQPASTTKIPSNFRPTNDVQTVYYLNSNNSAQVLIDSDGTFSTEYRFNTSVGSLDSQSTSFTSPTISFVIA